MVSSSSLWKQAALQVIQPLHPPPAPPSSCSLTKSNWRLGVALKKGQANYAKASLIPTEELFEELDDVDFLKDKNIGIDGNDDCSSPTPVLFGKEGFIPAGSLSKDYPFVDYEGVFLLQVWRQSKKAVENEEVASQ